jgi:hypothetical protein
MPSRKQRRRREKTFRHEYVWEDDAGNEAERLAELKPEVKQEKPAKAQAAAKGRSTSRRELQPPSWDRAFRRGGMWGAAMFILVVFFLRSAPIELRIGWGIVYGLAFIPFTYLMDRTAYRAYLRRLAKRDAAKNSGPAGGNRNGGRGKNRSG